MWRRLSGRACLVVFAFVGSVWLPVRASNDVVPVLRYAGVLRSFNPGFSMQASQDMAAHVLLLSRYYNLDPRLLVAIVGVESGWQTHATSHAGAQGLGQLMPATANGLAVLSLDPYENLDGTARYLRRMLQQFSTLRPDARYASALASYNAGPAAVARYGGVPPFGETQAYVARVMMSWRRLQTLLPESTALAPLIATTAPVRAGRRGTVIAAAAQSGSAADFMQLEGAAMRAYDLAAAAEATPSPPATREQATVRRWFARAFRHGR